LIKQFFIRLIILNIIFFGFSLFTSAQLFNYCSSKESGLLKSKTCSFEKRLLNQKVDSLIILYNPYSKHAIDSSTSSYFIYLDNGQMYLDRLVEVSFKKVIKSKRVKTDKFSTILLFIESNKDSLNLSPPNNIKSSHDRSPIIATIQFGSWKFKYELFYHQLEYKENRQVELYFLLMRFLSK